VTTVYNLDGSESKNTVQGRGGATEQVSKAVWDGAKLVVTTTINAGGTNIEQKRVFAMEGGNLTIETTQPGRDGGPGTPAQVAEEAHPKSLPPTLEQPALEAGHPVCRQRVQARLVAVSCGRCKGHFGHFRCHGEVNTFQKKIEMTENA